MPEYKLDPTEHLKLVKSIAHRYRRRNPSLNLDDLISAGYEGLLRGCLLFDSTRGVQPSTYLYKAISSYIRDMHKVQRKHRAESFETATDAEGRPLEEKIAAPEAEPNNFLLSRLEREVEALSKDLTPHQLDILKRRVLKTPPDTLQAIADTWGTSRQSVFQNEALMLKKLRKRAESWNLDEIS